MTLVEPGTARRPALLEGIGPLAQRCYTRAEVVPLAALEGWEARPEAIVHRTGRFFRVQGAAVAAPGRSWDQPILHQPEVGLLGMLVRRVDGVTNCLVQLKPEPGNVNGLQVSPTVQATRSNYTGVHGGAAVPHREHFAGPTRGRALVDVAQSEQCSWFLRKHNRNMVVQAAAPVEPADGFGWVTLDQLLGLLAEDDVVNMDTRSVLACLLATRPPDGPGDRGELAAALRRSWTGRDSVHPTAALARWIHRARRTRLDVHRVPLAHLREWRYDEHRITHREGRYFDIIGVRVQAAGREVARWSQPMLAPHGIGLNALLVTRVRGVLHVLVQLLDEPGGRRGAELAPTVQCTPADHDHLPAAQRPRFLDDVLGADPSTVLFDSVLSDEGGRFHHARSRHVVLETPWIPEPPLHRWLTVRQLGGLMRHCSTVTMQARSMLACLGTLLAGRSG
jgi:oxidase EvaA